jgi:hypothetical protein
LLRHGDERVSNSAIHPEMMTQCAALEQVKHRNVLPIVATNARTWFGKPKFLVLPSEWSVPALTAMMICFKGAFGGPQCRGHY